MAGREDFGILRSEILTDRRAHRAADLLVERTLAVEATAFPTVCGLVTLLGLWAMRETDNGVLPDDGVLTVQLATLSTRGVAPEIIRALTDAGLLRVEDGGVYLVGFRDCYQPITERREANREAKALARAEAAAARAERAKKLKTKDVPRTSAGHPQDVSGTSAGRPKDIPGTSRVRQGLPYRAVPAVPSGTERNGTAGHGESHPSSAGGSALASGADAEPPAATVGAKRNGSPSKPPRETLEQARARGQAEQAARAAEAAKQGPTVLPATPTKGGMTDDERDTIRLAGQLATLPEGDPRAPAAAELLAERPRDLEWNSRARALLGGAKP